MQVLRRVWNRLCYFLPDNFKVRDLSPEALARDVDYAVQVGSSYLRQLGDRRPLGTILDLGPGWHFGPALMLAGQGARALVADRFLSPWRRDYHPRFYRALLERLEKEKAAGNDLGDLTPLRRVVEGDGYVEGTVELRPCPAEDLHEIEDGSVDVVLSNAVFEHLRWPEKALAELHRVTRPGGIGLHQVDFRWHPDFDDPLRYLLMSDSRFERVYERRRCECGNRIRPDEMAQLITDAGFIVDHFEPNLHADPAYLDAFIPKLRKAIHSRYHDTDRSQLEVISGHYRVHRPEE